MRIAAIMAKAENLKKQGKPMSDAEIGIAISSVRKCRKQN